MEMERGKEKEGMRGEEREGILERDGEI